MTRPSVGAGSSTSPEDLVGQLRAFLEGVEHAAGATGGHVVQFVGNASVVAWRCGLGTGDCSADPIGMARRVLDAIRRRVPASAGSPICVGLALGECVYEEQAGRVLRAMGHVWLRVARDFRPTFGGDADAIVLDRSLLDAVDPGATSDVGDGWHRVSNVPAPQRLGPGTGGGSGSPARHVAQRIDDASGDTTVAPPSATRGGAAPRSPTFLALLWLASLVLVVLTLVALHPRAWNGRLAISVAAILAVQVATAWGLHRALTLGRNVRAWAYALLAYASLLGVVMLLYWVSGRGYANLPVGLLAWTLHLGVCVLLVRGLRQDVGAP